MQVDGARFVVGMEEQLLSAGQARHQASLGRKLLADSRTASRPGRPGSRDRLRRRRPGERRPNHPPQRSVRHGLVASQSPRGSPGAPERAAPLSRCGRPPPGRGHGAIGSADQPMGWVTGVEPNARLRTLAASRAQDHGVPNVSFVDGLAGGLPFEDSSVDLVWCERVLQHLNDPGAAIDDIARVLRPGGRAVLLDADQGTRIISDLDPDVASAFIRASLVAVANPYAARHIPAQVRRAGLTQDPDVGSSAFIFSSDMLLRSQVVQRAADDAVESGGLARDVAAA